MAKMTIGPVTYEGTPEELQAIVALFPTDDVAATEEPVGSLAVLKTEKRHAKVGERILITNATMAAGKYVDGDVRTVKKAMKSGVLVDEHAVGIYHEEYEVIVEPAQAKAQADRLEFNGADYSLVQRKAQAGDVVVFTENRYSCLTNGKRYEVGKDGITDDDGDCASAYNRRNNRTEANVLVYEKVVKEAPKQFPQNGDIVRITTDRYSNGFTKGAIGVVVDADKTFSPLIEVGVQRGYARVEIVAPVESRVDFA